MFAMRDAKRLALFVGAALILLYVTLGPSNPAAITAHANSWLTPGSTESHAGEKSPAGEEADKQESTPLTDDEGPEDDAEDGADDTEDVRVDAPSDPLEGVPAVPDGIPHDITHHPPGVPEDPLEGVPAVPNDAPVEIVQDDSNSPEPVPADPLEGVPHVPDNGLSDVPKEALEGNPAIPEHTPDEVPGDIPASPGGATDGSNNTFILGDAGLVHQEVFSLSTTDNKFFFIDFGDTQVLNPNIIPHPVLEETWIVVAQQVSLEKNDHSVEVVCEATFQDQTLRCLRPATVLPIAATTGDMCEGDLAFLNLNVGPHDARVFYGPENPFIVYGSNSDFTCFGQFVQDFTQLVDWEPDTASLEIFIKDTEMQRPPPWSSMEKNWFLFWDADGQMYAHYDVAPRRIFAKIEPDGSVGNDLAPFAEESDEQCLERYVPKLAEKLESVHQATNSLKITMCERSDNSCVPSDDNTFIISIFQHKTFYSYHSVYEPYVMAFRQRAPFEIHAISSRPLWIHGREQHPDTGTADMFYVTSMSWKSQAQKYHGYLDDELFLGFGIEDEKAGGIDMLASHLLEGLSLCKDI